MKRILPIVFILVSSYATAADFLPLDDALRATYTACVGIDDELADLKTMAGINTAVTSVGTAAGIGATVTGFVKASTDKKIESLEKKIQELIDMEQRGELVPETDPEKLAQFSKDVDAAYDMALRKIAEREKAEKEKQELTAKSKNLGNWRTGLLAGGAATNVAGAVIAGVNKVDADLQTQINDCRAAVENLRNSLIPARINGTDTTEAEGIISACGEYDYVDVSKINKRATGAMVASVVGAATGVAGTVTSAVANTNKTRDDNSDGGKKKEKNLNTAANVLSIGTTAASATATVFNATQISAIKKVAAVAEKCTGVLK